MLDSYLRPYINPPLSMAARQIVRFDITANQITYAGFALGGVVFICLWLQAYIAALVFLAVNRLTDGLDGAVARYWNKRDAVKGTSDYGGYIDIVLDMIFYAGFVFFFCAGRPDLFPYGAFVIFSFVGTSSSFLTYGIMAAKRGEETALRGRKSFFHAGGLIEGTETIIFMALVCLLPDYFAVIAIIFAALCWVTVIARIKAARDKFSIKPGAGQQPKP